MVRKFTISVNLSLDGTQEFLNSSTILSNGLPTQVLSDIDSASDIDDRRDKSLPGAKRGSKDAVSRKTRPQVRCTSLQFSPTGRSFCAATTEGLLIYSLDSSLADVFDPFDLDIDITPQNILTLLSPKHQEPEYLKALIMSFRLSDTNLIRKSYESIPFQSIELLVRDLPRVYLAPLLRFIGSEMDGGNSPHLEFHLRFLSSVLAVHGRFIKEHQGQYAAELRGVMRGVNGVGRIVRGLSERNGFEIEFLCQARTGDEKVGGGRLLTNGHQLDDQSDIMDVEDDEDAGGEAEWIGLD